MWTYVVWCHCRNRLNILWLAYALFYHFYVWLLLHRYSKWVWQQLLKTKTTCHVYSVYQIGRNPSLLTYLAIAFIKHPLEYFRKNGKTCTIYSFWLIHPFRLKKTRIIVNRSIRLVNILLLSVTFVNLTPFGGPR